jgi:hypothetical protein
MRMLRCDLQSEYRGLAFPLRPPNAFCEKHWHKSLF